MELRAQDALERSTRALLVAAGPGRPSAASGGVARPPVAVAIATWYDGVEVWCTLPGDGPEVAALDRAPACVLHVAPDAPEGIGARVRATARVFSLRDPLGLLLHAPTLLAALTALGVRAAPQVVDRALDGLRSPSRALPEGRVAVRLRVDAVDAVRALTPASGIAPPVPTVVPPDVRRLVVGRRQVVLAVGGPGALAVQPMVWGPGFALTPAPGAALPDEGPATLVVQGDDGAGVALEGVLDGGRLRAERARWWSSRSHGAAEIPSGAGGALGSITLPD